MSELKQTSKCYVDVPSSQKLSKNQLVTGYDEVLYLPSATDNLFTVVDHSQYTRVGRNAQTAPTSL